MKVQMITAFKTSDGKMFQNEREAIKHQQDLLGEALDDLLPYDDRGNVTQVDRFNLLMKMLDDKNLKNKIYELNRIMTFIDKENDND